jgi:hypothetical protein
MDAVNLSRRLKSFCRCENCGIIHWSFDTIGEFIFKGTSINPSPPQREEREMRLCRTFLAS